MLMLKSFTFQISTVHAQAIARAQPSSFQTTGRLKTESEAIFLLKSGLTESKEALCTSEENIPDR